MNKNGLLITDKKITVPMGVVVEFTIRFSLMDRLKMLIGYELLIVRDAEGNTDLGSLVWRLPPREGFTRVR